MSKNLTARSLAFLISAVALSACGSSTALSPSPTPSPTPSPSLQSSTSTTAVPWLNKPAVMPTTTTSTEPSAPPCSPSDLEVGSVTSGGALGSSVWSVPITNSSRVVCSLPETPRAITATGPGGERVSLQNKPMLESGTVSLPAGRSITFMMQARDTCNPSGTVFPTNHYHSVDLEIPTGVLKLENVHLLLCNSQIFSAFQPQLNTEPPPPGSIPSLSARLTLPRSVKAGSEIQYLVTLENETGTNVSLRPCPIYQEGIFITSSPVQKTDQTLQLNCSTVSSIPAQGQVSFEMVISVPSEPGLAKFSWHIGPGGPYAGATLTIGQ